MLGRTSRLQAFCTLLQVVSRASALPYAPDRNDGNTNTDPNCSQVKRPQLANEVYQIADGQLQVSYTVVNEEVVVTSESSTIVTSSAVTSFYTFTPVLRQYTSFTTSLSTATLSVTTEVTAAVPGPQIGVDANGNPSPTTESAIAASPIITGSATPAPSALQPPPAVTTSVPDEALTVLTTSEVQAVTAPPPTHTSGVSRRTAVNAGDDVVG